MASKSPIFPMPEPHHFSDYGFDPQIDYFQFMEEAKKHKKETGPRPIDSLRFKLQKPISKDDQYHSNRSKSHKNKKKRWWRKAFMFLKYKWVQIQAQNSDEFDENEDVLKARARAFRAASISGPIYLTESRLSDQLSTPYRTKNRPSSGPLAGTLTPARKNDLDVPYLSLRELSMEQQQYQRSSTSALPIYLVT